MSLQGYSKSKVFLLVTITGAEKIQVSVFLPNEHFMDDWYTAVYALPTVWLDVMMGINKYAQGGWLRLLLHADEVRSTWYVRQCSPAVTAIAVAPGNWAGWYSVVEREERFFTNRSNQPADDMKDEVRTDDDWHAWKI